jgi:hypothetical protein
VTFSGMIPTTGAQTYSDTPMNYTTFVSGQGQGAGFGVWYFDHAGNAGSFLADNPTNMSVGTTKGFGLWANGGGRAAITRSFAAPMKSGDSFNVKFDNNWMDNGAQVGFELRDSNAVVRLRFFFIGGESNYRIVDAQSSRATSIAYTANGLDLTLTLGAGNAYTLNTGAGELTGNLAAGAPIAWVQFFNQNAGSNTERNVYVGAMSHTVSTTGERTVTATASVIRVDDEGSTDGLPDSWWGTYFENQADWVAANDPDRDGFSNSQEHALGTDPTDAASRLDITSIVRTGNTTTVEWMSVSGKKYRLYGSPTLTGSDWQPVGSEQTAASSRTTETHSTPADMHFYRVRLVP